MAAAEATKETLKQLVIDQLTGIGEIPDSWAFAAEIGCNHERLYGVLKSLEADEQTVHTPTKKEGWKLTPEGEEYKEKGSPEAQVFQFVKGKGQATQAEINEALGAAGKVGMGAAMKSKWVIVDATKAVKPNVAGITDDIQNDLKALLGAGLSKEKLDALKKRKMILATSVTVVRVQKSSTFSVDAKRAVFDLTADMIQKGTWATTEFKTLNLENVSGTVASGGHLHPLSKVMTEMRNVVIHMGFEEMRTNQWVESSFWNFDSLFQPQQHPARDAHDTFFIGQPSRAQDLPPQYVADVKEMHESGGKGSVGWRYDWSEDEARKNLLRTHTTSVSARHLYAMGQEYQKTGVFTPRKCFSIDRVFRNETLDATHLAEFHQLEGFVADRNLGLGHLIGVLREFFKRVGISKIRFKPAYNPYTEPSMEVFGFHPTLKRWIEVGNSGVFRPEMLLPMGLPQDVSVIAWGIGVERWAAMLCGVKSIRELFSFQQDIASSKRAPVCWLRRVEIDDDKED